MDIQRECRDIIRSADMTNQRNGQALLNSLPREVYDAITGTDFDPFYMTMNLDEMIKWFEDHIIIEGTEIVAVFSGARILWEQS